MPEIPGIGDLADAHERARGEQPFDRRLRLAAADQQGRAETGQQRREARESRLFIDGKQSHADQQHTCEGQQIGEAPGSDCAGTRDRQAGSDQQFEGARRQRKKCRQRCIHRGPLRICQ